MESNLFGHLINEVLNSSLYEDGIANNETEDNNLFDFQTKEKTGADGQVECAMTIRANISDDDIQKIGKMDPTLISRSGKAMILIKANDLETPDSPGYKKLQSLCQAVAQTGHYGKVTFENVLHNAILTSKHAITKERRAEVEQDEDKLYLNFIENFSDPRVQLLLQSINRFCNFDDNNLLDHRYSERNIMRILAQNSKRIAAGKQPATFVAKPQDWAKYNRRPKLNSMPIYLVYKKDPGIHHKDSIRDTYNALHNTNVDTSTAVDYLNNLQAGGSKTYGPWRKHYYNVLQRENETSGFDMAPYYDVSDTEVIPGQQDLWASEERIGVTNNIEMTPTTAGQSMIPNKSQNPEKLTPEQIKNLSPVEAAEYFKGMSTSEADDYLGVDVEYVNFAYYALVSLCALSFDDVKTQVANYLDINKMPNMSLEDKKIGVFKMATAYASTFFTKEIAKLSNRIEKAEMVACMFVCQRRISPSYAIRLFNDKKESLINASQLTQDSDEISANAKKRGKEIQYRFKIVYNGLCNAVRRKIAQLTPEEYQKIESLAKKDEAARAQETQVAATGTDGLSQQTQQLAEAKFYRLLNKMVNVKY